MPRRPAPRSPASDRQGRSPRSAAMGSNGYAIGADGARDANALLLSNTHFPSGTDMRWYELHLTIPGKLDAIGAALQGVPVVNLGFNRHIAWTHTVSTARRFAAYELKLAPGEPTSYVVDGKTVPMRRRTVRVGSRSHTFYETRWGPVVVRPDATLDLDGRDRLRARRPERGRTSASPTSGRPGTAARSVAEWRRKAARIQGNPWVNSIVADDKGNAYYGDDGAVPNLKPPSSSVRHREEPAADERRRDRRARRLAHGLPAAARRRRGGARHPRPEVAPAHGAARLHVQLQRLLLAAERRSSGSRASRACSARSGSSCRARGWPRSWPSSGSRAPTASARRASRSTTCARCSSPTAT